MSLEASKKDKSLTKGKVDSQAKEVSLTFNEEQKEKYELSLKEYLDSNPAEKYSHEEYKLIQYSDDSKKLEIQVQDESTLDKYPNTFKLSIGILLQRQILDGIDYKDASVTVKITCDNGKSSEQIYSYKDIY